MTPKLLARPRPLAVIAFVVAATLATPATAEPSHRAILRRPKLGWVLFSAAWLGGSIWAQPRHDFAHSAFSYVPAIHSGLYLGATAGGLLGDQLAAPSREGPNWGPALAGMLIGGLLGAGGGVALGYAASRNTPVYYGTQAVYAGVLMFTLPLIPF